MKLGEYLLEFAFIFTVFTFGGKTCSRLVSHAIKNDDIRCFKSDYVMVAEKKYAYAVYVPDKVRAADLPIILFLHGAGERGSDGRKQIKANIGNMVKLLEKFPALAVFPQCPADSFWTNVIPRKIALTALDSVLIKYGGDKNRVYLIGISMGGYGVWSIGALYPEKFAALAPICGGIRATARRNGTLPAANTAPDPYKDVALKVKNIPIWIFHGGDDDVIPPFDAGFMVDVLRACGGSVKYTKYLDKGHNIWSNVFASETFWQWLFAQKKRE